MPLVANSRCARSHNEGITTYSYIWELHVHQENKARFEAAPGPRGEWVNLFQQDLACLRTDLLQARDTPLRSITFDSWWCRDAYLSFQVSRFEQIDELDAKCEASTIGESSLGSMIYRTQGISREVVGEPFAGDGVEVPLVSP
jgi:hypothetical protein